MEICLDQIHFEKFFLNIFELLFDQIYSKYCSPPITIFKSEFFFDNNFDIQIIDSRVKSTLNLTRLQIEFKHTGHFK